MHEISIASSLLQIVEEKAALHGIASVSSLRLKVGELAAVEPATLTAAFEVLAEGTVAAGAALAIETVPLRGECGRCRGRFRIEKLDFRSPCCPGAQVAVVGGKELYLESLEATTEGEGNDSER